MYIYIYMHFRTEEDVQWNAQGRNKAISLGQVGIRCIHCARLPNCDQSRGATYFTSTLDGLYQAAQNLAKNHLCLHCREIPPSIKISLLVLKQSRRRAPGGMKYWSHGANTLGVIEIEDRLRFHSCIRGI
jgi:hypothetical protein